MLGMDGLLSRPFDSFIIVFCDFCADLSAPRIAYKILDPRAIEIEKFGVGYKIGLAVNEQKGVEAIYGSLEVENILGAEEIDITFPFQDGWYSSQVIPSAS